MKRKPYSKGVFGRNIKIRPDKPDATLLVDTPQAAYRGTVVAVGHDVQRCEPGDKVIFNSWARNETQEGEETFYYILEMDEFLLEVIKK